MSPRMIEKLLRDLLYLRGDLGLTEASVQLLRIRLQKLGQEQTVCTISLCELMSHSDYARETVRASERRLIRAGLAARVGDPRLHRGRHRVNGEVIQIVGLDFSPLFSCAEALRQMAERKRSLNLYTKRAWGRARSALRTLNKYLDANGEDTEALQLIEAIGQARDEHNIPDIYAKAARADEFLSERGRSAAEQTFQRLAAGHIGPSGHAPTQIQNPDIYKQRSKRGNRYTFEENLERVVSESTDVLGEIEDTKRTAELARRYLGISDEGFEEMVAEAWPENVTRDQWIMTTLIVMLGVMSQDHIDRPAGYARAVVRRVKQRGGNVAPFIDSCATRLRKRDSLIAMGLGPSAVPAGGFVPERKKEAVGMRSSSPSSPQSSGKQTVTIGEFIAGVRVTIEAAQRVAGFVHMVAQAYDHQRKGRGHLVATP